MSIRVMHMLHDLEVAAGDTGSTVRLGFKWADVNLTTDLKLCVCTDRCKFPETCGTSSAPTCENCTIAGTGVPRKVWVGRFRDVPAYLLSFEHEHRSREYWGLFDSMRKAYGDAFSESSFVTVVVYDRTT